MNLRIFKKAFLFFVPFFLGISCSDDFISSAEFSEVNNPNEGSESNDTITSDAIRRSVSYKMEGDFSGKLDVTFLSSDGFTPPDQIVGIEIPWETDYDIPDDTQAIGGFANGLYGDANPGETASLKMFLDDHLIETVIRTSDEEGLITLPLESYPMEFDKSGTKIPEENIGKDITYAIDGNFSGNIVVVYTVADGSRENIEVAELPWEYTFTTTECSYRASIYGLGSKGTENQEIGFSLLVDETLFKSETVIADSEGRIGLFPEIVLEFD